MYEERTYVGTYIFQYIHYVPRSERDYKEIFIKTPWYVSSRTAISRNGQIKRSRRNEDDVRASRPELLTMYTNT